MAPVLRSLLGLIPIDVLLAHPDDILVFQEKSNHTDHLPAPQILHLHQRHQDANDPANPRWKLPASEWTRVLQRIEQGETLRQIARDYGVSYEAVRRVVRAARCQPGNGEA